MISKEVIRKEREVICTFFFTPGEISRHFDIIKACQRKIDYLQNGNPKKRMAYRKPTDESASLNPRKY